MNSVSNWSSYKRKQINIEKAVFNPVVSQQLNTHYRYLHNLLVNQDSDEDIFNDTFLKLTYNYQPDTDFKEQFIYYFKLLKGAYYRDDKVAGYMLTLDSAADIADMPVDEDKPVDKPSLNTLKESLQSYANFKKASKKEIQID